MLASRDGFTGGRFCGNGLFSLSLLSQLLRHWHGMLARWVPRIELLLVCAGPLDIVFLANTSMSETTWRGRFCVKVEGFLSRGL